ncbi:MAG: ABC transporter permease [Anaerolineae bacterium]|nr:ABC transporter permease [Anaerolineae bacterium]
MLRFVIRRILFIILVYVCIIFFVHLGMRMIRNSEVGKPDYDLVGFSKMAWQDTQSYLTRALKGDLGSVRVASGQMPLQQVLRETYLNSMGLLLVSLLASTVIGTIVGTLVALIKREAVTLPLLALTILGISTPSFFAGLFLQIGALEYLTIFGRRLVNMAGFGWDLEHMLMPVLVLSARPLAYLTRATFIALDRTMQEDYIRTAFSKGLALERTVVEHALRNIAVPILTAIGVSLRFSLGTLPIVELFFAWPGIGRGLLEAINMRHTSMVTVLASSLGLTLLLINLFLDIAYRMIDPRMREQT